METIDTRSFKQKVEQAWWRFIAKVKSAFTWIIHHPAESAMIAGCVIGGVSETRRVYDRVHEAHEDHLARTSVYCNDVQGRVRIKHELNYKENRELRDRMNEGQTKFEALDEMGLLK